MPSQVQVWFDNPDSDSPPNRRITFRAWSYAMDGWVRAEGSKETGGRLQWVPSHTAVWARSYSQPPWGLHPSPPNITTCRVAAS